MSTEKQRLTIRTSTRGWMQQLAKAYKDQDAVVLEDDAAIGIDPRRDTILDMGRRSDLSARDWYGILISLGVAAIGAWLLVMAVLDPEPYSKVAVAIATGAVLLGSGGFYAVRILTNVKPPRVSVSRAGVFEIDWS